MLKNKLKKKKLVLFYLPNCHICKEFMSIVWKYFVNNYKQNENIKIEQANCETVSIFTKYRMQPIDACPEIILFIGNQAFIYNGKRCICAIE